MKLAVENSSKHRNYVEAVLRDWVDKGYQTLDDVHAARLPINIKRSAHLLKRRQDKNPFLTGFIIVIMVKYLYTTLASKKRKDYLRID
jgi:DNA replication protein DnaD